jgi:hypothetical protein
MCFRLQTNKNTNNPDIKPQFPILPKFSEKQNTKTQLKQTPPTTNPPNLQHFKPINPQKT